MTPEQLQAVIKSKMKEIEAFRREDLPDIIGVEAVNHYNENFVNEGFTDESTKKWANVERRDPASEWYGFSDTTKNRFSAARSTDKILTGETTELKNSIHYVKKSDRVTVGTDKPYAAVHQFGLPAKIFGKKEFVMKARPFIGKSKELNNAIQMKIERELKRILNL